MPTITGIPIETLGPGGGAVERKTLMGASIAATLPAALAAAVLVSAPFAGTKTTPLSDHHKSHHHHHHHHQAAAARGDR